MKPSAYPNPSTYVPAPHKLDTPTSSQSATDFLPPEYEVLLEVCAIVNEPSASPDADPSTAPPQPEATLRVIQGPLDPSQPSSTADKPYHAFISTRDINIPLLRTTVVAPVPNPNPPAFRISLSDRVFDVTLNPHTEPELVAGFIQILKWFCKWDPAQSPHVSTADVDVHPTQPASGEPTASKDRFASFGDAAVRFIEKSGTAINAKINTNLNARTETARGEPGKDIKMGGKVTSAVLGGTRKVVGAGASLASAATTKISGKVASGVSKSSLNRSLSEAPEGSFKKSFHNNLMSGLLAFGRIYVAADTQGKIIIESTGDSAAELAGVKYGSQAEKASRNVAGIALDSYRILRFPKKLGATAIVKGAFKSKFANQAEPTANVNPSAAQTYACDPTPPSSQNETLTTQYL